MAESKLSFVKPVMVALSLLNVIAPALVVPPANSSYVISESLIFIESIFI